MSRALRSGAPRLLGFHGGTRGRWYAGHFQALSHRLGPFKESAVREYAGAVAVAWVGWREATEALTEAQRLRRDGKGRRPSTAQLARLQRRQGLQWQTYDQALRRLEELARGNGHPRDPVEEILGGGR